MELVAVPRQTAQQVHDPWSAVSGMGWSWLCSAWGCSSGLLVPVDSRECLGRCRVGPRGIRRPQVETGYLVHAVRQYFS